MKLKLDLFAIDVHNATSTDWQTRYVKARNFRVTKESALVFYSWPWERVSAFPPGAWQGGAVRLSGDDAADIAKRLGKLRRGVK